jgi:type IV pilus assembly protein PilB
MTHYQRMGEWLISAGLINAKQLEEALRTQRASRGRLGEILTSMGWVTEDQVLACLSDQYSIPIIDLDSCDPEPAALRTVSMSWSQSHLILPIRVRDGEIDVVVSDPIDVRGTDEVFRVTRLRPRLSLATPTSLFRAIPRAYSLEVAAEAAPVEPRESPAKPKRPGKVDPQKDRIQLLVVLNESAAEPNMWTKLTGS